MQNQKSNPRFDWLISPQGVAIFGVIGGIAICVSFYYFYLFSAQSKWVGTYARVTDGSVFHIGRRPYFYKVRLLYKYQVEGQDYLGACELSPTSTASAQEANALLAKYIPNGRALEIYYDPKKPKNSLCRKAESNLRAWQFLVGGILSFIAAFLINRVSAKDRLL